MTFHMNPLHPRNDSGRGVNVENIKRLMCFPLYDMEGFKVWYWIDDSRIKHVDSSHRSTTSCLNPKWRRHGCWWTFLILEWRTVVLAFCDICWEWDDWLKSRFMTFRLDSSFEEEKRRRRPVGVHSWVTIHIISRSKQSHILTQTSIFSIKLGFWFTVSSLPENDANRDQ